MFSIDTDTVNKRVWLLKKRNVLLNPTVATSCFVFLNMLPHLVPADSIPALPFWTNKIVQLTVNMLQCSVVSQ
jgi:hypothetical protein